MSWFELVKILPIRPSREILFVNVLVNRAEMENHIRQVREFTGEPRTKLDSLKGVLSKLVSKYPNFSDLYAFAESRASMEKNLTEAESEKLFGELQSLVAEKQKEYGGEKYLTKEKVEELLNEGLELKNAEGREKLGKILEEIAEKGSKDPKWWSKNIPLRDKLQNLKRFFEQPSAKAYLTFKNKPTDVKVLEKFAKMIGGDHQDGVIFVEQTKLNDLIKEINKTDAKGKQTTKKFWQEFIRPLKMEWNEGTQTVKVDSRELATTTMNIKGTKLTMVGTFDYSKVKTYIKVVNGLKGSVKKWKPSGKLPNGNFVPEKIFLERGSGTQKNLMLNPYASIIMDSSYGENWFKEFFGQIRQNQILSEEETERRFIQDIATALINDLPTSQLFRVNMREFDDDTLRGLKVQATSEDGKKKLRQGIRDFIESQTGEDSISERMEKVMLNFRRQQLDRLRDFFTVSEATEVVNTLEKDLTEDFTELFLENLETEEEKAEAMQEVEEAVSDFMETIEESYFDENGISVDRKEDAFYIALDIDGERMTPQAIQEEYKTKGKMEEFRRNLVLENTFTNYVLSVAKEKKLSSVVSEVKSSASALESVNPKNSLAFLDYLSETILPNDEIGEAFKKISDLNLKEEEAEATKILDGLNEKMPEYLKLMKVALISVFEERFKFFLENYGQSFPKVQASSAIKKFKKANMLREEQKKKSKQGEN